MRQLLHSLEFACRLLPYIFRKVSLFEPFAKLFGLRLLARIFIAKLFLDRLHLLTKHIIALRFVHLVLRFRGDLRTDLHYFQLASECGMRECQQPVNRARFEHLLLCLGPEIKYAGEKVCKLHGILLRHYRHTDLGRNIRQQGKGLLYHPLNIAFECLDLFIVDDAQL